MPITVEAERRERRHEGVCVGEDNFYQCAYTLLCSQTENDKKPRQGSGCAPRETPKICGRENHLDALLHSNPSHQMTTETFRKVWELFRFKKPIYAGNRWTFFLADCKLQCVGLGLRQTVLE